MPFCHLSSLSAREPSATVVIVRVLSSRTVAPGCPAAEASLVSQLPVGHSPSVADSHPYQLRWSLSYSDFHLGIFQTYKNSRNRKPASEPLSVISITTVIFSRPNAPILSEWSPWQGTWAPVRSASSQAPAQNPGAVSGEGPGACCRESSSQF